MIEPLTPVEAAKENEQEHSIAIENMVAHVNERLKKQYYKGASVAIGDLGPHPIEQKVKKIFEDAGWTIKKHNGTGMRDDMDYFTFTA